jgi:hypothetical protein
MAAPAGPLLLIPARILIVQTIRRLVSSLRKNFFFTKQLFLYAFDFACDEFQLTFVWRGVGTQ